MSSPSDDLRTNKAIGELLRAAGLKRTPARLAVLRILQSAQRPLTCNEVHEKTENLGVDKVTVYRTLVQLTQANLVSRFALGDNLWRFAPTTELPPQSGCPTYFLCVHCGNVRPLMVFEVRLISSQPQEEAAMRITEVLVKGDCGCSTGPTATAPGPT